MSLVLDSLRENLTVILREFSAVRNKRNTRLLAQHTDQYEVGRIEMLMFENCEHQAIARRVSAFKILRLRAVRVVF
ncbi:DNA primase large subunit [Herbaspirillum sp. Sphag1AN]|nr:DNA primase large subunit [Herbaspirillum sp. Sphag1AN]MBB3247472.1 DNA primase large subunit [Herbaspirillum sp. Sphag64]